MTIDPDDLASQAADALEDEVGVLPELDCGDDDIDLVDGTTVDCVLTDPTSGYEYDAVVTISDVDGTDFHLSVEVAETPNE